PHVFINARAGGSYGMANSVIYTEETNTAADGFLAEGGAEWEKAALSAEDLGMRTVRTGFGIILDNINAALSMMEIHLKVFIGGKIGNGEQWMSWVHIDDVVDLIYFSLTNDNVEGPINATAPNPLRNKDFTAVLGN